jgi:hypothetical protein
MMKAHFRIIFVVVAALFCVAVSSLSMQAPVEAAQQAKPPMFVLQVGIGKYLDSPTWSDLRGSVTDVVEMRKVLVSDRFQVPATNIVTLTNEQATKQRIFAAYQSNLIEKAKQYFEKTKKRDAVVLFQYSGHGSQAPDVDGDEADKLDETLVTYDSQDIKGKNFDITDDEIFILTAELKRYTDNIVYIFDSCHSGSGTRTAEDARRLPPRTTVPEPVPMPGITTRSGSGGDDGSEGSMMPPGSDYVVISAAQADQIATQKYCFEECGSDKEPVVFGLLTYYLIDELKNSRGNVSYRELMQNVSRKVEAERPSQTPLLEGDDRRTVFGNLAQSKDTYLRITSVEGQTFKLGAGAIQGITVGSIVSIYDPATEDFDSAAKKATGRVTAVTATTSTVQLPGQVANLTISDKAIAASTDLTSSRSKVILDTSADPAFSSLVRGSFSAKDGVPDSRGVDVLSDSPTNRQTGRWDLAVLKDKYTKAFPKTTPKCLEGNAAADPEIYYITAQDYVPLFGFCVDARSSNAAGEVTRALTHIARYRSVQQIQNRRSRLAGKINVKPIRLVTNSGSFNGRENCVDGKFTVDRYEPITASVPGRFTIGTGEVFWFEVTNNSPFDAYVSMLNLQSDGSISVKFPRNIEGEKNGVLIPKNGGKRIVSSDRCRIDANGDFVETGAFRSARQPEIDAFKFLVTTKPLGWDQLSFLEMDSISHRNESATLATIDEWIAVDLVFDVGGQKK